MRANILKDMIDTNRLTIGDVLLLKHALRLTDSEAILLFLGGGDCENLSV